MTEDVGSGNERVALGRLGITDDCGVAVISTYHQRRVYLAVLHAWQK